MKLILFSAEWCGQCKVVKPKIIDICNKNNINLQIVDADSDTELINKYNIKNLPTGLFFDNEENLINRKTGWDILDELNKLV